MICFIYSTKDSTYADQVKVSELHYRKYIAFNISNIIKTSSQNKLQIKFAVLLTRLTKINAPY